MSQRRRSSETGRPSTPASPASPTLSKLTQQALVWVVSSSSPVERWSLISQTGEINDKYHRGTKKKSEKKKIKTRIRVNVLITLGNEPAELNITRFMSTSSSTPGHELEHIGRVH